MDSRSFSSSIARLLFVPGLLAGLAACSSTPSTPPADVPTVDVPSVDVPAGDAPSNRDVPRDRPARRDSPLFGPCASSAECQSGLTCRTEAETGHPGGECSLECTNSEECAIVPGVDGWCPPMSTTMPTQPRFCQRVCLNGIDCERDGYTCQTLNAGRLNEVRICVPVCTDASCENGTTCSHETGRCHPADRQPTGRTVGQSCEPRTRMGADPARVCQSDICQADWNPDSMGNRVYTGWNGGMCTPRCILPQGYNSSTYWPEMLLPRANCPMGAICLPNGSLARGDLGICLPGCMADSDCRVDEGYYCRKTIQLSATNIRRFTNGNCLPRNCLAMNAAGQPMGCPMGYTCRRNTNGTGSCIPSMMTP